MADIRPVKDREHGEELHPEVTTPQGTQRYAVDQGHEAKDVDLRKLGVWGIVLLVIILGVHLTMKSMFGAMYSFEQNRDVLPSPMFAIRMQPPPSGPRLLPNPDLSRAHPEQPMMVPGEVMKIDHESEDRQLQSLGLEDASRGVAAVPLGAAAAVEAASPFAPTPAAPADGLVDSRPSQASGGLQMENSLR